MKIFIQLFTIIFLFSFQPCGFAQGIAEVPGNTSDDRAFRRENFLTKQYVVPPSPEPSQFARYGSYNVDYSTGTAIVELEPLHTLSGQFLQLPIQLRYDASGNKVNSESGFVGLGFTLQATGSIARSVLGFPDLMDNYYSRADSILHSAAFSDILREQRFLEKISIGEIETQADQYFISIPNGVKTKFYISPDTSLSASDRIYMPDSKDLRIKPTMNSQGRYYSLFCSGCTGLCLHF